MSAIKESYNVLPRLSFRWVKANELLLNAVEVSLGKEYIYKSIDGEGYVNLANEDLPLSEDFKGVNRDMVGMVEDHHNAGLYVHVKENEEKSLHISHVLGKENDTLIEKNVIVLEKGAKMNLIMDYSSDDAVTFSNILNKISVAEGAELNIIKVQRLNSFSRHLESRYSTVEESGKVNYISVELGGKEAVVNYMTDLLGDEAEGHVKSVYLGFGERVIDLFPSYEPLRKEDQFRHDLQGSPKGQVQEGIPRNPRLQEGGQPHSEGNEEEFTILLSPKVKSYAIPLLLCREDDVIGNHAASNGQIDAEKLFYIMSRGMSESEAKKIIIESHIRPIIDLIPVESIQEIILEAVEKELTGE